MTRTYKCIGTMSGTSLDGLDIVLCTFSYINNKWDYVINKVQSLPYSLEWKAKLSNAENLSGFALTLLHNEFGRFTGEAINKFMEGVDSTIDFVASHGHTIFHQPLHGITLQIGSGAEIAAITNITTICDFRSIDVALHGQGAPLVPIGDKILFSDYDFCLNLGGFANISFDDKNKKRIAFDICPANIILNLLVKELGLEYDSDGIIARKGEIQTDLLEKLNNIPFYKIPGPKSLGKEWLQKEVIPLIEQSNISTEDKLRTVCEHIAIQIQQIIEVNSGRTMLVTGGGAHNKFLLDLITKKTHQKIDTHSNELIDFKEALIFGFLGLLRFTNSVNCLQSVTGATRDNIGGAIYLIPHL